jgi:nucleotide-binding universal stress UspA family protein
MKKAIWAVDPFGDPRTQSAAATLAQVLNRAAPVEAVYIHGSSPIESDKAAIRAGLLKAESKLKEFLKKIGFKGKSQILAHGADYVRAEVKTLTSYAKKSKADVVLLSTKARSGLLRQILGSFAETLMLESSVPTMIVNPKAKVSATPGIILFPTDYSDLSLVAYKKLLNFAKDIGASVKLFHQYQGEIQSLPKNVAYYRSDKWLEAEDLLDDELIEVRKKINKWFALAKKQGVPCHHTIKFGLKNIADATLELAKKENPWMIAMASVTGPVAATFLGSNARWVVRDARCPVWVMHVAKK